MNNSIPDIFISYSTEDVDWVTGLAQALTDCGYSVWWSRKLKAGENYHAGIENALKTARCVVTVWSPAAATSEWVLAESNHARKRGVLVPLVYLPTEIPLGFQARHYTKLQDWLGDVNETGFQDLLRGIESVLQQHDSQDENPKLTPTAPQGGSKTLKIPNRELPKIALATLFCLFVILALIFWGGSTPKKDSSINSDGDLTIKASGNSKVQVNTGDGKVQQKD